LAAIGQEAQHVADQYAGQASTALEQLARAYTLLATGPVAAARSGFGTVRLVRQTDILDDAGASKTSARW
jgi:hypothetical protein